MKKILLFLLIATLVFSCTKDVTIADATADLSSTLAQYDDSNIGTYIGVFTTQGTMERGVLEINITPEKYPVATIKLVSGIEVNFKASQIINDGDTIENLEFISAISLNGQTAFKMSVDQDGTNVQISDVVYNGTVSGIIASHQTSRAPVVPITGVLACDDCDAHPLLVTGDTGTFSLLFSGDGTGDEDVTALIDVGTILAISGAQTGCSDDGVDAFCDLDGGDIIGTNTITWIGGHHYLIGDDCSEAGGLWDLDSGNHGLFTGSFTSDTTCVSGTPGDVPATAIPFTPGAEGDGCAVETDIAPLLSGGYTDSGLATGCATWPLDIFYSWTATTDGLTFTGLNPSSTTKPLFSVLDAATLTEIACGDGSFGAIVLSGWSIGDDLLLRIAADDDIPFCLEEFTVPPIPANDTCMAGEDIFCGDIVAGNTVTATNSDGDRGNDVWYVLIDASSGDTVTLSLCGSVYDTHLTVYDACGGAVVAANDDFCGGQSELSYVSDGTFDFIRVDGFSAGDAGAFTLSVTCVPPPSPFSENNVLTASEQLEIERQAEIVKRNNK